MVDREVEQLNKGKPGLGGARGCELRVGDDPPLEKVEYDMLLVGTSVGHRVETLDGHDAAENQDFCQRRHNFTPQ